LNNQPYGVPTSRWAPEMTPWWFRATSLLRNRELRKQKIERIDIAGLDRLATSLSKGHGILLAPNHSFHWDSYCLVSAAERLSTPFYIMTAWQVFHGSGWFAKKSMQRCGCFSVDREGTDLQAMKTAVDILQSRPHPLVIFPEGDVYHTNDRVTPFRDGAAAIGLMAARKSERPIDVIPVAIKRWYTENPTPSMLDTIARLETRLYWRPQNHLSLVQRILHVAEGLLSLKEMEHLRATQSGPLGERIQALACSVLDRCETRYQIERKSAMLPERVKEVRRKIISERETHAADATPSQREQWSSDMDDMFLATQLYSYPGDYLTEHPSVERLAETLDKLEEDALGAVYPTVRASREVLVQFDDPIELPRGKESRMSAAELTDHAEKRVQMMLDEMNRQRPSMAIEPQTN
jgi:1-acyl-sn-glycerol-3-phosphate acyltransferase